MHRNATLALINVDFQDGVGKLRGILQGRRGRVA
jgi:hypothetical protein